MECKDQFLTNSKILAKRINRNIVECKVGIAPLSQILQICINRNIVECKEEIFVSHAVCDCVLIEILWNVKEERTTKAYDDHCINRNIVECKGSITADTAWNNIGINRNIVECKECIAGY